MNASVQVNWQMLWVSRRKRAGLRIAGWLLLTVVIIFPIGIFTGEHPLHFCIFPVP